MIPPRADQVSQLVDVVAGGGLAVADRDDVGAQIVDFEQALHVLRPVEVEGRPAEAEVGPGGERVACEQHAALLPVEAEVAR